MISRIALMVFNDAFYACQSVRADGIKNQFCDRSLLGPANEQAVCSVTSDFRAGTVLGPISISFQ